MFYVGQKINSYEILLNKHVDDKPQHVGITHGDYYMVRTAPGEYVIIILPLGESSKKILRKAVEKELLRIRGYQGKTITI